MIHRDKLVFLFYALILIVGILLVYRSLYVQNVYGYDYGILIDGAGIPAIGGLVIGIGLSLFGVTALGIILILRYRSKTD